MCWALPKRERRCVRVRFRATATKTGAKTNFATSVGSGSGFYRGHGSKAPRGGLVVWCWGNDDKKKWTNGVVCDGKKGEVQSRDGSGGGRRSEKQTGRARVRREKKMSLDRSRSLSWGGGAERGGASRSRKGDSCGNGVGGKRNPRTGCLGCSLLARRQGPGGRGGAGAEGPAEKGEKRERLCERVSVA